MEKNYKNNSKNPNEKDQYCPNCGEPLPEDAKYCRNCGFKIKPKKESFFKKNSTPIMFVAIVLIMAAIAVTAFSFVDNSDTQTINVGTINFKIPSEFKENPSFFSVEDDSGIITISKAWESSADIIKITVMYSNGTYVDANRVNDQIGGHKESLLGHSGFFHESHDTYSFSFVKNNMLVTIYTSDIALFDEIEVL
ncbi:DUF2116 family Zn-ribbon domain-containing protein [Methanobrevibacter sp.]|uniref:zinc-ribbon domain-containing protein n=1 Tax=Methanobrevibacter sp. TaxID=66852 RepID=UPI00386AFDE3